MNYVELRERTVIMPSKEVADLWRKFIEQEQIYNHQMNVFYKALQDCKGMEKWLGN